jgi:hypothetical protein
MLITPIFGFSTAEVTRDALAMVGCDVGPGVIALDSHDPSSFNIQGTATFNVGGGALFVNSDHPTNAVTAIGSPVTLDATEVFVTGGADPRFVPRTDYGGAMHEGVDPIPDPLAALPEPVEPQRHHGNVSIDEDANLQPGSYDRLRITGDGTVTLAPGLYYINDLLELGGTAKLDGSAGVMFFIGPNGSIKMDGTGEVLINPMSPLTYPDGPDVPAQLQNSGVSIFQSRSNTDEAFFRGTNDWDVKGTLYVPSGTISVGGTMDNFSNGMIAGKFSVFGNGTISVNYLDQFPRVPRFVFLVE